MEDIADMPDSRQANELKNIIEAAIVFSDEPITIDRMLAMFTDDTKPERAAVKDIISELEQDYANRGIELKVIDKGYRLQTRQEYSPWLSRLTSGRPPRYSRALLETLAIIAYRQPVTRGEIEEIRGVAVSTDIIRTLLEREWIRQVGVRDVPGKPALFATTKMFLEYFSLESLSQLPPLMDIRDMETIAAELNMTLPLEEAADDQQAADNGELDDSQGDLSESQASRDDRDDSGEADDGDGDKAEVSQEPAIEDAAEPAEGEAERVADDATS